MSIATTYHESVTRILEQVGIASKQVTGFSIHFEHNSIITVKATVCGTDGMLEELVKTLEFVHPAVVQKTE